MVGWDAASAIADILMLVVTGVGLVFVWLQVRAAARSTSADVLLRLEDEFAEQYWKTFLKFATHARVEVDSTEDAQSIVEVEQYLNFFGTLGILESQRLVDLRTIDRMFAHRFFIVANSPNARRVLALKGELFWEDLRDIHERWTIHRRASGRPIPGGDAALFPLENLEVDRSLVRQEP